MSYRLLPLTDLVVNRANDRHGELENETAAIAWLFNNREQHMRNLAKDIVQQGRIYEPPLVSPNGNKYIVFDGNRRVTCLKVLGDPSRAPNAELQRYFSDLRAKWQGPFPDRLQCQIETDQDRLDEILFRRHTGSQGGVGQSTWDDRMKTNFVNRTGKGSGINVAEEIERRLEAAGMLPKRKVPRSTLNRLLSSEAFRNRLGFTASKGRFELTHEEPVVLTALQRIADDLAHKRKVLGHLWDTEGKRKYLDELEQEQLLPTDAHAVSKAGVSAKPASAKPTRTKVQPLATAKPSIRTTLIKPVDYGVDWTGSLQRHRAIWEELQFHLKLSDHPNAVAVLVRVLLELSVENYISKTSLKTVYENDKLGKRVLKVAEDLKTKSRIDDKYLGLIRKMQQQDELLSMDTLNRYVHSSNFAPSPHHLTAIWDTLAEFVVLCLNA